VLTLHGELDLATAPLLQGEIDGTEIVDAALVVLDVDDLEFIDSTGLRIVLAAHERSQERGQEFALTRGSQQVQRLLSITRVGEHLRILDSPGELLV
jgi:anti-anti-sigma factor